MDKPKMSEDESILRLETDKFRTMLQRIRFYRLVFFQGSKSDEKIFIFDGGLKDAELRGRAHCNVMGYRFGIVRPAIVDLDHQEKLKYSNLDWDDRSEMPEDTLKRKELSRK